MGRSSWSGWGRSGGQGGGSTAVRRCGGGFELGQAGEVVGGGGQLEPELVAGSTEIAQLAASANRLGPAGDLLDPLAPELALAAARMPGGAAVDGAAPAAVVLGDPRSSRGQAVRGHTQGPRPPDEVARVIGGGPRPAWPARRRCAPASPASPHARPGHRPRSARRRRLGPVHIGGCRGRNDAFRLDHGRRDPLSLRQLPLQGGAGELIGASIGIALSM